MYRPVWNSFYKSVCSLNFFTTKGIQFFRSTGFRYENYLISDFCDDKIGKAGFVVINFPSGEQDDPTRSIRLPIGEFRNRMSVHIKNTLPGVLVLSLRFDELRHIPSIKYTPDCLAEIGTPVAILCYSRQINQLHMKTGVISSYLDIKGDKFIFISSSFEQGNSGSPLINAVTGKVIGVIVDCFSSPARNHKKLKKIIDENIRMLNDATGRWTVGNIDPAQVLAANQNMIKHLAKEIYLSVHRNSGFALPAEKVYGHIKNLNHRSRTAIHNKEEIKVKNRLISN